MKRSTPSSFGRGGAIGVRRVVNNLIAETAARSNETDQPWEFFCECGDLGCLAVVQMTVEEYGASEPGTVLAHA